MRVAQDLKVSVAVPEIHAVSMPLDAWVAREVDSLIRKVTRKVEGAYIAEARSAAREATEGMIGDALSKFSR